jgi:hypothetical protein
MSSLHSRRLRRPVCDQFGRQRRKPIKLILGPAVLDRHVLALDIAGVLEPWRRRSANVVTSHHLPSPRTSHLPPDLHIYSRTL